MSVLISGGITIRPEIEITNKIITKLQPIDTKKVKIAQKGNKLTSKRRKPSPSSIFRMLIISFGQIPYPSHHAKI